MLEWLFGHNWTWWSASARVLGIGLLIGILVAMSANPVSDKEAFYIWASQDF